MPKCKTTRVQMELPKKSMDRLRELKNLTESTSYTEVIKDSLLLYEYMLERYNSTHLGGVFIRMVDKINDA